MGRPSKKEERTEEILNAFYRCVAHYGLAGSTLERIADESGLKRSLVRHFVGNREALVTMLVDRVLEQSQQQWQQLLNSLSDTQPSASLLEGLFSDRDNDGEFILVIESLIFAAGRDAQLQQRLQSWLQGFTDTVETLLRNEFNSAPDHQISAVAYGLISLYFNLDSLAPLGINHRYRAPARQAAQTLLNSLIH